MAAGFLLCDLMRSQLVHLLMMSLPPSFLPPSSLCLCVSFLCERQTTQLHSVCVLGISGRAGVVIKNH